MHTFKMNDEDDGEDELSDVEDIILASEDSADEVNADDSSSDWSDDSALDSDEDVADLPPVAGPSQSVNGHPNLPTDNNASSLVSSASPIAPTAPPSKRSHIVSLKRKLIETEDDLVTLAVEEDEFDVAGKIIAAKLRELSLEQRILAEKLINEIMLAGEMGVLTSNSVLHTESNFIHM